MLFVPPNYLFIFILLALEDVSVVKHHPAWFQSGDDSASLPFLIVLLGV